MNSFGNQGSLQVVKKMLKPLMMTITQRRNQPPPLKILSIRTLTNLMEISKVESLLLILRIAITMKMIGRKRRNLRGKLFSMVMMRTLIMKKTKDLLYKRGKINNCFLRKRYLLTRNMASIEDF